MVAEIRVERSVPFGEMGPFTQRIRKVKYIANVATDLTIFVPSIKKKWRKYLLTHQHLPHPSE